MNARLLRAGIIILSFSLAGCATLSKDECRTADWYAIGYEDGDQGRGADYLAKHRKACARVDVTPDFEAYESGRESGLRMYCAPSRGYSHGAKGRSYNGICPADLEPDYIDAFEQGQVLYQLKSEVSQAANKIESIEDDMEDIEQDITDAEFHLINDDNSRDQRKALLEDIAAWRDDLVDLELDLNHWLDELDFRQTALENYRVSAPAYYTD